jgi:excisionase family DNA binding protein
LTSILLRLVGVQAMASPQSHLGESLRSAPLCVDEIRVHVVECLERPMNPLLTIPETADVLHIPEGSLRKMVTARQVPYTRIGKHCRFSDTDLCQIVGAGASPALPRR